MARFRATFITDGVLQATFIPNEAIDAEFESFIQGGDVIQEYEGEYIVEPTFSVQTLETAGKKMTDDLTVNRIAVNSVENLSGGLTVTIGG